MPYQQSKVNRFKIYIIGTGVVNIRIAHEYVYKDIYNGIFLAIPRKVTKVYRYIIKERLIAIGLLIEAEYNLKMKMKMKMLLQLQ